MLKICLTKGKKVCIMILAHEKRYHSDNHQKREGENKRGTDPSYSE